MVVFQTSFMSRQMDKSGDAGSGLDVGGREKDMVRD